MNANPCIELSEQDVRNEAYLLYVSSGCIPGHEQENWLEARARLMARAKKSGAERLVEQGFQPLHFPLNTNVSRSPFGVATLVPHKS